MKKIRSSIMLNEKKSLESSIKRVTFEDLQEKINPLERTQNQSSRGRLKEHSSVNQDKSSESNSNQLREKQIYFDELEGQNPIQTPGKTIFEFISYNEMTIAKLSILQLFRKDQIFKKNELGNIVQLPNNYISLEKLNQLVTANNEAQIKEAIFSNFEKFFVSIEEIYTKDYKKTFNSFKNFFHIILLKEISPTQPVYEVILDIFKDQNGYFCRGMVLKKGSFLSCLYRNSEGFTLFKGYAPNKTFKSYSEAFLAIVEEGLIPIIFFYKKGNLSENHQVSNEITLLYKKLVDPPNQLTKVSFQDLESFASANSKVLSSESPLISEKEVKVSPLRLRLPRSLDQSPKSDNLNSSPLVSSRASNRFSLASSAFEKPLQGSIPFQQTVVCKEDLMKNTAINRPIKKNEDAESSRRLTRKGSLKTYDKTDTGFYVPFILSSARNKIESSKDPDCNFWMCPACLSNVENTQKKCKCGYIINQCKICSKLSVSKVCRNCKDNGLDFCEKCNCFFKADKGKCEICEGKVSSISHRTNKSEVIISGELNLIEEIKKCEICLTGKGAVCIGCLERGYWKCGYCNENNRGGYICESCSKYNMERYRNSSSIYKRQVK